MAAQRQPLSYYLSLTYPYTVVPDDGSFFIEFPDLPGCMTQVEDAGEIGQAAEEIRALWIETAYDDGQDIPEPTPTDYSGRFVVRVPKSLHRDLALAAKREGMSLNAYIVYLLSERNLSARLLAAGKDEARTTSHTIDVVRRDTSSERPFTPWKNPDEDLSRLSPMERRALDRMEKRLLELMTSQFRERDGRS